MPSNAFADDVNLSVSSMPMRLTNTSVDWSNVNSTDSSYRWIKRSLAVQKNDHNGYTHFEGFKAHENLNGKINTTSLGGTWQWYNMDYGHTDRYNVPIELWANLDFTGYCNNTMPMFFGYAQDFGSGSYAYIGMAYFGDFKAGQRFQLIQQRQLFGTSEDNNGYNFAYLNTPIDNYRLYCQTTNSSNFVRCQTDSDGYYVLPSNAINVIVTFRIVNDNNFKRNIILPSPDLIMMDKDETDAIRQQTSQIMSTFGSGGIVDSALNTSQQVTNRLGFVSQSAEMVTGIYDAVMNVSPSTSVTFPGVQFQSYVIIPPTDVPLLGYLPDIEQPIKLMITGLLVLAWLGGIKKIYGRIFLGEVDVISEDDE